jgi:hypothetical protein
MTSTPRPDGALILTQLHTALTRYVILPSPDAAVGVTLWIAASHAQPAWAHAARLVIRGPEKRCGKSRLLDVIEGTCHAPLITVNASPAAVYRAIGDGTPPTVLVDEADTIFGGKNGEANEDLRGLLNAGHQRNRPAIRWDPSTRQLETITTFAMAALAGIGAMPDTIEDRAVVIRMRRRAPGERVAPFRYRRDRPGLAELATQLADWLAPHLPQLEQAEPAMPLEDRAADTWEPLIAVADLAGAGWPELARHAAVTLTAEWDATANVSDRVQLLADCRTAFGDSGKLPTTTLIDRLRADPEAPWSDHGPAGITAKKLAEMLREYDIRSENIRFGEPIGRVKGYHRDDFADTWARYCPLPEGVSVPAVPAVPGRPNPQARGRIRGGTDRQAGTDRSVPGPQPVPGTKPGPSCGNTPDGTAGTDGTDTPRFNVIDGGAA